MDAARKKALWQCHPDLRTSIRVADFLPSLHVYAGGFLNDVENDSIRKKKGHVKQVDELMDILLKKESKNFDYFCTVLEKEGYKLWSDKLREAAGIGKQQLSCLVTSGPFYCCQTCLLRCLLCYLGAKCLHF